MKRFFANAVVLSVSCYLIAVLCLLCLMGQSCEPDPQTPPEGSDYCHGNEYTILESLVDGVVGAWNTIIGGEPSVDRRSTVLVRFGGGYCSGVVLSPRTVLTAGHCGHDQPHTIVIDGQQFQSTKRLVHPDYLRYIGSGNTDREARKADLMMLYTDELMPGPYLGARVYRPEYAPNCFGLVAQGWGRHEEPGAELREAKYIITDFSDPKYLVSRLAPEGKICFGDSGGPLYADVAGKPYLAGITTTTMSRDCLTGGTHVAAFYFRQWINDSIR